VLAAPFVRMHRLPSKTESVRVGRGTGLLANVLASLTMDVPGIGRLRDARVLSLAAHGLGACGIAGVLSPRRLVADDQAVIVDLRGRTMRVATRAVALDALAALEGHRLTPTDGVPRDDFEMYTTKVAIEGVESALLLDTGACCTWVYSDTAAGRALTKRASRIASGPVDVQGAISTRVVAQAHIATEGFGGETAVYLFTGRPKKGEAEGAIGIDVLQSCVMAIDDTRLWATCRSRS